MLACTLLRIGMDDFSLGSGRPKVSCKFRRADRYDFIVWEVSPWSAKKAAYEHRSCSDSGNGVLMLYTVQNL